MAMKHHADSACGATIDLTSSYKQAARRGAIDSGVAVKAALAAVLLGAASTTASAQFNCLLFAPPDVNQINLSEPTRGLTTGDLNGDGSIEAVELAQWTARSQR